MTIFYETNIEKYDLDSNLATCNRTLRDAAQELHKLQNLITRTQVRRQYDKTVSILFNHDLNDIADNLIDIIDACQDVREFLIAQEILDIQKRRETERVAGTITQEKEKQFDEMIQYTKFKTRYKE